MIVLTLDDKEIRLFKRQEFLIQFLHTPDLAETGKNFLALLERYFDV